jgi:hypothetical protein
MNKYILLLPLLAIAFSQSLSISPELTYQYESDDEQYAIEGLAIQDYELIIIGQYNKDKLNILARMGYHLLDGVRSKPSDFTRQQGLHWVEHPPGIADDQSNYYVADLQLQYGDSTSYFYFNKWDKHWGPGVNSLTISNKIPRFFHFGFKWQLQKNIRFEYFHGKLKSGINDDNYTEYYNEVGSRVFDITRNIVGHRLEWQPLEQLIISGSELITYANRSIELTYLLTFVPFFPIQTYVGETDNVIMSADIQYLPNENIRLYGVFLMDEWAPPYTFDKDNRNWFGWQTGIDWKDIYLQQDRLRLEYTWTDHRIYRHRFPVNDFYSWGYPVGFWAGPHAQELYADYSFSLGDNHFEIMFSDAKRGVLTDSLLTDQYNRPNDDNPIYEPFSEGTEEKQVLLLSLNRDITEKLNFNLSYTFVVWKNAGFNPSVTQSDEDLPDITKHSMGIVIRYRY